MLLLTIATFVLFGPIVHFFLAKRAVRNGSYSPVRTAGLVAGGILAAMFIVECFGVFNFA
jgi:hypothetical protein